jgi:hypothetical protein
MTRRLLSAAHLVAVAVIAMAATWITALATASSLLAIAAGSTAAWLAQALLPCPCHRRGGRS